MTLDTLKDGPNIVFKPQIYIPTLLGGSLTVSRLQILDGN